MMDRFCVDINRSFSSTKTKAPIHALSPNLSFPHRPFLSCPEPSYASWPLYSLGNATLSHCACASPRSESTRWSYSSCATATSAATRSTRWNSWSERPAATTRARKTEKITCVQEIHWPGSSDTQMTNRNIIDRQDGKQALRSWRALGGGREACRIALRRKYTIGVEGKTNSNMDDTAGCLLMVRGGRAPIVVPQDEGNVLQKNNPKATHRRSESNRIAVLLKVPVLM